MAQIIYSDGQNTITYRMAKGSDDISGDYTNYEESGSEIMGNIEVMLRGSSSLISLATWTKDDCSYALSFSAQVDKEEVDMIIDSIGKE